MSQGATSPTDWDDLRLFLAVARTGSLSGAARELGLNHSTLSRRVGRLEERLGARLFERLPGGWLTTPDGDAMLATASRVEEEMLTLDRALHGRDARLSGSLRVAVPDLVGQRMMDHFAAFSAAYPGIRLEIAAGNVPVNLTQREADVALRGTASPPETLIGRRLAQLGVRLFAGRRYLAERPASLPLTEHAWIGWDDSMATLPTERWLREQVPVDRVRVRVNSAICQLEACRAGMGVTAMLCLLGDAEPELARLPGDHPTWQYPFWLLTHRDLRRTARVRAFMDFITEGIRADLDLLEGRRPRPD